MIALQLPRVRSELDLWRAAGQKPVFWIRDDDACGVTGQLERLCSIACRFELSIGLALIPGLLEDDLVAFLATHAPQLFPMCHGWKHTNHGSTRAPAEFGCSRPHAASCADASRAVQAFRRHFANGAVFVPPFGRISPAMIGALRELGFLGLSGAQRPFERRCARLVGRFGWLPAMNVARPVPLPRIDAHIDLIDWRAGTAEAIEVVAAGLVSQLRLRRRGFLAPRAPIGLLTHHRVHDEKVWELLECLVDFLKRREVEFLDIRGMFGGGVEPAAACRVAH
jgi:hypothetical protein